MERGRLRSDYAHGRSNTRHPLADLGGGQRSFAHSDVSLTTPPTPTEPAPLDARRSAGLATRPIREVHGARLVVNRPASAPAYRNRVPIHRDAPRRAQEHDH